MANAVIGALRVNLGLDSAQFQRGLANSQKGMEGFANRVKLGMAAAAAGITVAGTAMTALVNRVSRSAAATGDVADRLGISVESLQELRHAAEMSGVSVGNFDVALRRFIRRASEAARGTGSAKNAFAELGVTLTDSNNRMRNSEDIFNDVADAMAKIQDPANRLRLAFQMFDTDGAALVKMFENGSAGIQKFREQAQELGIVLSEEAVQSSSRFQDSLTLIGKVAEGFQNRLVAGVLPAFENLAARILDVASNADVMNGVINVVSGGMNLLARGIGVVFDNLQHLVDLFKVFVAAKIITYTASVAGAMITLARTVRTAGVAMALVTSITRVKITTIALLAAAVAKLTGTYDGMVGWLADTGRAIMDALPEGMRTGIDGLSQSLKDLLGDIDGVDAAAASSLGTYLRLSDEAVDSFGNVEKAAKSAADKMKEMQAEAARIFDQTRTPLEQYQAQIARLNELLQAGAIDQDTYNRAVLQAQDAFDKASKAAEKSMFSLESVGQSIAGTISNAFQGLINGSQKVGDVLKNLLSQLTSMMLNQAFRALLGGMGGGGGILGMLFGGFRAKGGPVTGGRAYVVGERGPELMVPNSSGTVIPNHALGGDGGRIAVDVGVSVDNDGNLQAYVKNVSRQEAGTAVSQGLKGYDKMRAKRHQNGAEFG